ncbi:MAG: tRNA (adenosine(37)-N6)-threonylcarbamoyltransferase complex transferase subunit TsaD [Chloroflexi bacterium]|nr:tRNA (adenosine(37)-N6)-threonylcarbamoyltransferase complex transferase subunit TsaD [Chloroflexota bacterium]
MSIILGIETSCDETAAAVIIDGQRIASNVVASQVDLHAQYGGVYPEVASRAHVEAIDPVVRQALTDAALNVDRLDAIAVTRGPGLVGSLLVGISYAKGLALMSGKPLLGINHLEGHIYSLWLTQPLQEANFPVVVLIVSGGHTELVLMRDHGVYERLGGTLDDAAGEAFDKVGRVLGLPFPGGPNIQRAAEAGQPDAYQFPRAKRDQSFDFSFSGLKTAVLREVTRMSPKGPDGEKGATLREGVSVPDAAASFQAALVDALVEKTVRAAQTYDANEILLAGGVSANALLRMQIKDAAQLPVRYPPLNLCTDNAAMIAAAAHYRFTAGQRDSIAFDVLPTWPLSHLNHAPVDA